MKRWPACLACLLMVALCACTTSRAETLEDWSFQYDETSETYSLFFALCDSAGRNISADAQVDVRIVNGDEETVYTGSHDIHAEDFGLYTNQSEGERLLANVKIPASDISQGTSSEGTVFFTVSGSSFAFDECSIEILDDLPLKAIDIRADQLPVELNIQDYGSASHSTIRIDEVSVIQDEYLPDQAVIVLQGEKIRGSGTYDSFDYKLYDSDEQLVDNGIVMLSGLSEGERFEDDSLMLFGLVPGERYTLRFIGHI